MSLVRYLLQNGAEVNCRGQFGETPIYGACNYHHSGKIKLLLDYGAQINVKDNAGMTPFRWLYYKEREAGQVMMKQMALLSVSGRQVEQCDLETIGESEKTQKFYEMAVDEATKLRNDKFFGNVTFFDVLDISATALFLLVKNDNFVKAFRDKVSDYTMYLDDLTIKVDLAVKRKELLYAAESYLDSVFGVYLPSAVIERLATFIIAEDLENIAFDDERINSSDESIALEWL